MVPVPPYQPAVPPSHLIERMVSNNEHDVQKQILFNYSIVKPTRDLRVMVENLAQRFFAQVESKNISTEQCFPDLVKEFIRSARSILQLHPERISIDLTSVGSMYIYCEVNKKKIHWEVFFTVPDYPKVVLNIFENKQQIFSDSGSSKIMGDQLKDIVHETPDALNYGLSGNITSTTIF